MVFAALRGVFAFLQAYWAEKNSQALAFDLLAGIPRRGAADGAHCIAPGGPASRPDYRLLGARLPLLRPAPAVSEGPAIRARLLAVAPRLSDFSSDHTIALMFMERALTELDRAETTPAAVGIALALEDHVLSHYFAPPQAAPRRGRAVGHIGGEGPAPRVVGFRMAGGGGGPKPHAHHF